MGELPGVSVVVKGTTNGTTTDLEGKFTLGNVKSSDILQFSFIGYKTQDIKVGEQRTFNITLEEDAQALDEVVVVGYQEVRKKDLTGSVSKVNMSDLLKTPSASFDQTLGGRIAGVNVSSGEGMPGGTMTITIRGNNSLTQDNTPLYIIDGFPVEDARVAAAINPNDIESTDVLKDASASSIYGSRAPFGVILITTKQGKTGKPVVSYNTNIRFNSPLTDYDMMDSYRFMHYYNDARTNGGQAAYFSDEQIANVLAYQRGEVGKIIPVTTSNTYTHNWANANTDWYDVFFKDHAMSQEHSLSLSGGTERFSIICPVNFMGSGRLVELC